MTRRWRLFPKYALLIVALVAGMVLASGAISIYFSHRENQDHLVALQNEKAQGAASRIEQYVLGLGIRRLLLVAGDGTDSFYKSQSFVPDPIMPRMLRKDINPFQPKLFAPPLR